MKATLFCGYLPKWPATFRASSIQATYIAELVAGHLGEETQKIPWLLAIIKKEKYIT
jgi:hypothetical protein